MEGTLKKENLWLLNVLRGISALLIVLYHYTVQYEKSIGHLVPYTVTIPWGCYAVNTFFMLSGFLAVYTCAGWVDTLRFPSSNEGFSAYIRCFGSV